MKDVKKRTTLFAAAAALALGLWASAGASDPPAKARSVAGISRLGPDARAGAIASQILAAAAPVAQDKWQPGVNDERSRGASQRAYGKAAPATVVVRCGGGHGTGFIVDPKGWIVTNHHVIADANVDPNSGASTATIHLGRIKDGWMTLIEEAIPAEVYGDNVEKDLALLKLTRLPAGMKSLPAIELADQAPPPGTDCVAIGHPASGMLWTVRGGEVAGVGTWPKEMIDIIVPALAASVSDRQQIDRILKGAPQRKVLLSSCGLNPGDSGGPLVDVDGKLIGVSFGVPKNSRDSEISLAKFSYHVHLDEVKKFLESRPASPLVRAPDPWPPARFHVTLDLDKDGKPDALAFAMTRDGPPTGILVDLNGDCDWKKLAADTGEPDAVTLSQFEFAVHLVPTPRAFYDTDGDGQFDLVLFDTNDDGRAESAMRLVGGKWKVEQPKNRKLLDASHFTNKRLAKRFQELKLDKPL
jgi:S1-C subfamily serine protease